MDEATITNGELIEKVQELVEQLGSQAAAAIELDISPTYISDLLAGRRPATDKIAQQFGYQRVTIFKKVNND